MKVTVVLLIVGALGTTAKGAETKITELQKTVLIYTSRILRKVLEV